MSTSTKRVFLVTGANSGLGFECALALAKLENSHVIAAGRNPQRIAEAIAKIQHEAAASSIVEAGIVDLSSLKSTRDYAKSLVARDLQFFTIVCNAGVQVKENLKTEDGFESTIGVNHVAHFLLLEYLKDRTKHIMTLSSETHDPAEGTGLPAPVMDDLDALAKGLEPFNGMGAYAASKLCNLLYAKEFARRYPQGAEIVAYTPGLTPDTALFRERPEFVAGIPAGYVVSTSKSSGGFMAHVAATESWAEAGWTRGEYIRVNKVGKASAQACDPVLGKALWDKSEEWVRSFVN